MKRLFCLVLILIFIVSISGCVAQGDDNASGTEASSGGSETPSPIASDMFTDRDLNAEYDESKSTVIQLNGDSAACESDAVRISGSTITITDEGTYILTGTLDDGMVIVDAGDKDKTQLVLSGAQINSRTSAPIYIKNADKVFITTVAGTTSTLTNGGEFTSVDDSNIDAVIFSKADITLNGSGIMVVTSPAGHGIVSKDSLRLTGGVYDINCASHALESNDDVCIVNTELNIVSGKDGIHTENTDDTALGFVYIEGGMLTIAAEGDGISASAYVRIEDGAFNISSGGGSGNATLKTSDNWGGFMGGGRHQGGKMKDGRGMQTPPDAAAGSGMQTLPDTASDSASMKGIKATADLVINGGAFIMNTADDAIHSNASVSISGGSFDIAAGDDAFHADDTLTVSGGDISITQSYEGLEGLHILINDGTITLVASDDGLNAAGGTDSSGMTGGRDGMFGRGMSSSSNGSIEISGGTLNITAYGDGIDANGTLDITGGFTTVCGPTQGDTATLDYDTRAAISGGTFIGTGATGMAQTFSEATQGVIAVGVSGQPAGADIRLTDSSGKVIIEYSPALEFSVVILSSPDIVTGETYDLVVGDISGQVTAD